MNNWLIGTDPVSLNTCHPSPVWRFTPVGMFVVFVAHRTPFTVNVADVPAAFTLSINSYLVFAVTAAMVVPPEPLHTVVVRTLFALVVRAQNRPLALN
jgi:hypothetical protein